MPLKMSFGLFPAATCGLAVLGYGSAFAQEAPQQPALEEIIVTAEKRASTLQKTPASVIVQSGDELVSRNITDIAVLGKAVPSFQATATPIGGGGPIVYMRGVGQSINADNVQPAIGFIFDGIYQPRQISVASFYDVSRVEVLPGPQGTLYGRNAVGGIINISLNKPTNRLEGSVLLEGGSYGAAHATGVLNVPIAENFALRGAVDYQRNDGYLSNGLNDMDQISGRLSMLLNLGEAFSLNASASFYDNGGKGPALVVKNALPVSAYAPDPSDPWKAPISTAGLFRDAKGQFISANASYDFGGATLSYLLGYSHYSNDSFYQLGSLRNRFPSQGDFLSQELRIADNGGGRSKWLAGLFWYKGDSTESGTVGTLPPVGPLPARTSMASYNVEELNSIAAFGQYTYSVTDKVRLTAGGRYSKDKFVGGGAATARALNGTVLSVVPYGVPIDKDRIDWKVGAEADIGPASLLYASVQTGYLPGGFTPVPAGTALPTSFRAETMVAYTAGVKNRFFNGRLQVNDEFFVYDYKNYQVTYVQAPFTVTSNVPKTEIYGNQLDVTFLVTPATTLSFSGTWLHAAIKKFNNPIAPFQSLDGYRQQLSPRLAGSVGLEHEWSLGSHGSLTGRVDAYYNSGFWGTYAHAPNTFQKRYTKTDLTLTYTSANGGWSLAGYVRNLENNVVYENPTGGPNGEIVSTISPPRTFGARVRASFP